MNNNNAKKKGGDGDTTKSTHDVSSDTEESLSIDEEDVEFVTKNALFTKRLLANSKELEEEKKGKNDKNKSHGDAKNDEDDDDDDNVERMSDFCSLKMIHRERKLVDTRDKISFFLPKNSRRKKNKFESKNFDQLLLLPFSTPFFQNRCL